MKEIIVAIAFALLGLFIADQVDLFKAPIETNVTASITDMKNIK